MLAGSGSMLPAALMISLRLMAASVVVIHPRFRPNAWSEVSCSLGATLRTLRALRRTEHNGSIAGSEGHRWPLPLCDSRAGDRYRNPCAPSPGGRP